MSAARKPVIVRKLTRDWWAGYASATLAEESGDLELLLASGKLLRIAWGEIKWVCYVRELPAAEGSTEDRLSPERLLRRRFTSRPRIAGLWLRLTLADSDELEGVAANDRSLIEGKGLLLNPPDTRSNTQRIFVPRSSVRALTVLAVVHFSATRERARTQPQLFEEEVSETEQDG